MLLVFDSLNRHFLKEEFSIREIYNKYNDLIENEISLSSVYKYINSMIEMNLIIKKEKIINGIIGNRYKLNNKNIKIFED